MTFLPCVPLLVCWCAGVLVCWGGGGGAPSGRTRGESEHHAVGPTTEFPRPDHHPTKGSTPCAHGGEPSFLATACARSGRNRSPIGDSAFKVLRPRKHSGQRSRACATALCVIQTAPKTIPYHDPENTTPIPGSQTTNMNPMIPARNHPSYDPKMIGS